MSNGFPYPPAQKHEGDEVQERIKRIIDNDMLEGIERVASILADTCDDMAKIAGEIPGNDAARRLIAVGKTDLQKGLMALRKSITDPDGF